MEELPPSLGSILPQASVPPTWIASCCTFTSLFSTAGVPILQGHSLVALNSGCTLESLAELLYFNVLVIIFNGKYSILIHLGGREQIVISANFIK